jgi:hypothetical protein
MQAILTLIPKLLSCLHAPDRIRPRVGQVLPFQTIHRLRYTRAANAVCFVIAECMCHLMLNRS